MKIKAPLAKPNSKTETSSCGSQVSIHKDTYDKYACFKSAKT